jgi:hypothetical protein
MTTQSHIGLAAVLTLTAFSLIVLSGSSQAEVGGDDLTKVVKDIAAELKKGNDGVAKKKAKAAARKIDMMPDLMAMYRPADKGGLDLQELLKKGATPKNAEELGNLTRAMAELTLAKGWDPDDVTKTKTQKAWNEFTERLNVAAKELAKAKKPADVDRAATKVVDTCAACHKIFK